MHTKRFGIKMLFICLHLAYFSVQFFFRDFCSTQKIWCVIFVRWMNKYNIKSIAWQIKRLFENVKMWGFHRECTQKMYHFKKKRCVRWLENLFLWHFSLSFFIYAVILLLHFLFQRLFFFSLHTFRFSKVSCTIFYLFPSTLLFFLLWSIPNSTCIAFRMLWILQPFFLLALHIHHFS